MLELKTRPVGASQAHVAHARTVQAHVAYENPQPRRLLLALVLLLVALAGVVLKDRQFWFGPDQNLLDDDATTAVAAKTVPKQASAAVNQSQVNQAKLNQEKSARAHATRKLIAAQTSNQPQPAAASAVQRTVLPPLDVEVIAGDHHHTIRPGSNATKVELTTSRSTRRQLRARHQSGRARADHRRRHSAASLSAAGAAHERAGIGSVAGRHRRRRHHSDLHVLSGPAILAAAAQQAVREWHFKPVLQNGSAVETKATITVNFNIKVADGSGTTLAESRYDGIQILSR
jgi:hypothetical protein